MRAFKVQFRPFIHVGVITAVAAIVVGLTPGVALALPFAITFPVSDVIHDRTPTFLGTGRAGRR